MEGFFNELREAEFAQLSRSGQTYLDYTGAAVPPRSIIQKHADDLAETVYGNPHSRNPASAAATARMDEARRRVLAFFQASPDEYEVIFTPNASGAIKLVAESFAFEPGSRLVLTSDNHNSVLGLRDFARARGARVDCIPLDGSLRSLHPSEWLEDAEPGKMNLFAFPAQSNFSGVQHPLDWVAQARSLNYTVLLDGAAFAPTSPLNVGEVGPDFVCLSFYKMFGYPTGVGALLARRAALEQLRRPWFAGGTVVYASARREMRLLHSSGRGFEDGTVNFLGFSAIPLGLEFLSSVGMDRVKSRTTALTAELLTLLRSATYADGSPLVRIYGPTGCEERGGTVAFNVLDPYGRVVDFRAVERRASEVNVSLRTGVFCNPGVAEHAFEYTDTELRRCSEAFRSGGYSLPLFSACVNGKPTGAVRVSVGIPTVRKDLDILEEFLAICTQMPLLADAA